MKKFVFASFPLLVLLACNSHSGEAVPPVAKPAADSVKQGYFPVSSYLRGQILEVRQGGVTPLKFTIVGDKKDSVFLTTDEFNKETTVFTEPLIDSFNRTELYKETKFLDETIAAFTYAYEPRKDLPDSLSLLRWTVYIDKETGKVKRVYMLRKMPENKTEQLSWLPGKECSRVIIQNNPDGSGTVEKTIKISWNY